MALPTNNRRTRMLVADKPGHTINGVAWSPDGERLTVAGESSGAMIWRVADGGLLFTYPGTGYSVEALAWSPDGTRIASGGVNSVYTWSPT